MSRINSQSLVWETASTPTLNSGWSGTVIVRRNLSSKLATVSCLLSKNNTTLDNPFTIPSGYRPTTQITGSFRWQTASNIGLGILLTDGTGTFALYLPGYAALPANPDFLSFTVNYWLP